MLTTIRERTYIIFIQTSEVALYYLVLVLVISDPISRNLSSPPLYSKRLAKNPLFEAISLHGPTGLS